MTKRVLNKKKSGPKPMGLDASFMLRLPKELLRRAEAAAEGKSTSAWMRNLIDEATKPKDAPPAN